MLSTRVFGLACAVAVFVCLTAAPASAQPLDKRTLFEASEEASSFLRFKTPAVPWSMVSLNVPLIATVRSAWNYCDTETGGRFCQRRSRRRTVVDRENDCGTSQVGFVPIRRASTANW